MTITTELRQAIEQAGNEPVRIEDPQTHETYIILKEETYKQMRELLEIDRSDRSLYEFGEFHPVE